MSDGIDHYVNEHPVGPAVLWSPLYLLGDGLAAVFDEKRRLGA